LTNTLEILQALAERTEVGEKNTKPPQKAYRVLSRLFKEIRK